MSIKLVAIYLALRSLNDLFISLVTQCFNSSIKSLFHNLLFSNEVIDVTQLGFLITLFLSSFLVQQLTLANNLLIFWNPHA